MVFFFSKKNCYFQSRSVLYLFITNVHLNGIRVITTSYYNMTKSFAEIIKAFQLDYMFVRVNLISSFNHIFFKCLILIRTLEFISRRIRSSGANTVNTLNAQCDSFWTPLHRMNGRTQSSWK